MEGSIGVQYKVGGREQCFGCAGAHRPLFKCEHVVWSSKFMSSQGMRKDKRQNENAPHTTLNVCTNQV